MRAIFFHALLGVTAAAPFSDYFALPASSPIATLKLINNKLMGFQVCRPGPVQGVAPVPRLPPITISLENYFNGTALTLYYIGVRDVSCRSQFIDGMVIFKVPESASAYTEYPNLPMPTSGQSSSKIYRRIRYWRFGGIWHGSYCVFLFSHLRFRLNQTLIARRRLL
jgi:hypothetical protein